MRISWVVPAVALFSGLVASSAPADPLHGRWSIDPKGCVSEGDTPETAPLTVNGKSINWFVARCTIRKTYKIGDDLYLQARCTNEGKTRDTPIALVRHGERLKVTWDNAPAGEMRRCQ